MALRYKLKKETDGSVKIEKKGKNNGNPLVTGELNLFDFGTLCQFETKAWRASKGLDRETVARISKKKNDSWYRATKDLIDRSALTELYAIITKARKMVEAYSTPFVIDGIHFVAAGNVNALNEGLVSLQGEFKEKIEEFMKQYPKLKRAAREILEPDGVYNPDDYPVPEILREKFLIHWRFFDLAIPSQLSDELKKQEQEQFSRLLEETKNLGIISLRKAFAEIVSDLHETLSGKLDGEKKRLNQGKLDKVAEFLNTFQLKNVFNDSELEKVIVDAKQMVEGLEFTELNKDKELSEMLTEEMGKIRKQLDGMVETYDRKISF